MQCLILQLNHRVQTVPCRKCDLDTCLRENDDNFKILHGCGHSYHISCFPDGPEKCTVCEAELTNAILSLLKVATTAIFNICDTETQSASDSNEDDCDDDEDDACSCSSESNRSVSLSEGCLQLQQQIFRWGLIPGP